MCTEKVVGSFQLFVPYCSTIHCLGRFKPFTTVQRTKLKTVKNDEMIIMKGPKSLRSTVRKRYVHVNVTETINEL